MSRKQASYAIALSILLVHGRVTPAQSTATIPATSTQSGVYTAEQADRGKSVYLGKCRSCHNPSTGDAFARLWAGKTLLDLFGYVLKTMPSNDPGTLDPGDNADVVAYLLQSTGMPTGERELPADSDSLKAIRIDLKDVKKDPPPPTQRDRRELSRFSGPVCASCVATPLSREDELATMYVRHPVLDYAKWRRAFDDHAPTRERYGINAARVQRAASNPLEIIVTLEAEDLARAREFADSADLRESMIRAGVVGRPEIWYAEDVAVVPPE